MMKKIFFKKFFSALVVISMMTVTLVSASPLDCAVKAAGMREYLGSDNYEYDFNSDGVVNLSDVVIFSQSCGSEEVLDETDDEEVSEGNVQELKVVKKSRGLTVRPMPDGSISYMVKGRAFQLEPNVVVKWSAGTVGVFSYNNYLLTVEDGVGVNVKKQ